jgi:hypothetical protein
MNIVASTILLVTTSLSKTYAKNTLVTNWTEPNAARSDCAAYPKEIKLRMFPNMNTTTPAEVHYHHIRPKMMKNHHKKYITAGLKE